MTSQTSDKPEAGKKDQKKQIILLVLIIALFGYLYFFTGLFRPASTVPVEQEKKVAATMVKKPIPDRGGAVKSPEPSVPAPPSALPEQATQKQAPPAPKPPPAAPVPAQEKPQKAVVKPAPKAEQKPAAPAKPSPPKEIPKAAVPEKSQPLPVKSAQPKASAGVPAKTSAASYTLFIGEFPEGKVLNDAKGVLKKNGIAPVAMKSVSITKKMHRLVSGEYTEHDAALSQVQKMREKGVDAFMIEGNAAYIVYAGSYLYADRAEVEKERLQKNGMNVSIASSDIKVKLFKVTAGSFPSPELAEKAAGKLKEQGLTPRVVAAALK